MRITFDRSHVFGILEKCREIKEMVYYNKFKTGPQKLGLQDSVIAISFINSGNFSLSIDTDDLVEDIEDLVKFISTQKVEQSLAKSLSRGERLVTDDSYHRGSSATSTSASTSAGMKFASSHSADSSKEKKCIIMNVQTEVTHPEEVLKLLYSSELDSLLGLNGEIDPNDTGGFEHIFDFSMS